jgi:hypothetical protein
MFERAPADGASALSEMLGVYYTQESEQQRSERYP